MAQPLVKKDDDRDDEAEYSPFLGIEKGAVLQEARVFHDPQLDARRCSQVITKLLYLLNQGETFTKVEATEVFFAVTKLFQSKDTGLRRMVYLIIKELSPSNDEVIIVTSSLMKDMNSKTDMYRANAIRVLCRITDGTLLTQIERYLKQAIVDKNPVVASAALVSGVHLLQTNPEIVKRWSNEVQEAVQSRAALVQFHALALLHQIRQNDRLAVSKLVTSLTKGSVRSPLAQCLLIRYTSQVIRETSNAQSGERPFFDYLESCLRHKAEMVIFEAARAITELSGVTNRELTPAITVLQLFLSSSKPVLRFAAVRTLNKVAMTHPLAVTNCNIDMESLISDQNRSIATLAITTLLKTGNESSVDRLMKQITNFMSDIADEFKIVVVEAIRSLCLKFPLKYRSLMNFLSNILREEGGFEFKKAIVDSIVILIRDIPDAKENGLFHLCEFIEDCEFTYLSTQILHFLGNEGPKTSDPSKYIRYIYNRVILENATVRAAAVSTLAKFGALVESLKPRIFVLLRRCLFDIDDETEKMTPKEFYMRKKTLLQESRASVFDRLAPPKKQMHRKLKGGQAAIPSTFRSKFQWRRKADEDMEDLDVHTVRVITEGSEQPPEAERPLTRLRKKTTIGTSSLQEEDFNTIAQERAKSFSHVGFQTSPRRNQDSSDEEDDNLIFTSNKDPVFAKIKKQLDQREKDHISMMQTVASLTGVITRLSDQVQNLLHENSKVQRRAPSIQVVQDENNDEEAVLGLYEQAGTSAAPEPTISREEIQKIVAAQLKDAKGAAVKTDGDKPYLSFHDQVSYPKGYNVPKFKQFNGLGNPDQHLAHFVTACGDTSSNPSLLLRQFAASLTGVAFEWYANMQPESIQTWQQMKDAFRVRFGGVSDKITIADLANTRQNRDEKVIDYVMRWRNLSIKCEQPLDQVQAVGLLVGNIDNWMAPFLSSSDIHTFQDLISQVKKLERTSPKVVSTMQPAKTDKEKQRKPEGVKHVAFTTDKAKEAPTQPSYNKPKPPSLGSGSEPAKPISSLQERMGKKYSFRRDKVMKIFKDALKVGLQLPESKRPEEAEKKDHPNFCPYHRILGHSIENCYVFKDWIERQYHEGKITLSKNVLLEQPAEHTNYISVPSAEEPTWGQDGSTKAETIQADTSPQVPKELAPLGVPEGLWEIFISKKSRKMLKKLGELPGVKWWRAQEPKEKPKQKTKKNKNKNKKNKKKKQKLVKPAEFHHKKSVIEEYIDSLDDHQQKERALITLGDYFPDEVKEILVELDVSQDERSIIETCRVITIHEDEIYDEGNDDDDELELYYHDGDDSLSEQLYDRHGRPYTSKKQRKKQAFKERVRMANARLQEPPTVVPATNQYRLKQKPRRTPKYKILGNVMPKEEIPSFIQKVTYDLAHRKPYVPEKDTPWNEYGIVESAYASSNGDDPQLYHGKAREDLVNENDRPQLLTHTEDGRFMIRVDKIHELFQKMIEEGVLSPKDKVDVTPYMKNHPKYCPFHSLIGHTLEGCHGFKGWIDKAIEFGTISIPDAYFELSGTCYALTIKERCDDGRNHGDKDLGPRMINNVRRVLEQARGTKDKGKEKAIDINEDIVQPQKSSTSKAQDYNIAAHLRKIPAQLSVFDALMMSQDLRDTLIHVLQNPEEYQAYFAEAHMTEALYTFTSPSIKFSEKDLLLGTREHNRPLYVTGSCDGTRVNRILIDPGSSVNLMTLKTLHSLALETYHLSAEKIIIQGFNQHSQKALGSITLPFKIGKLTSEVKFHVINTDASYRALLGRPWLHENYVVPSTLHQCLKYMKNDEVYRIDGEIQPFGVHEVHYDDARYFVDKPKGGKLYASKDDTLMKVTKTTKLTQKEVSLSPLKPHFGSDTESSEEKEESDDDVEITHPSPQYHKKTRHIGDDDSDEEGAFLRQIKLEEDDDEIPIESSFHVMRVPEGLYKSLDELSVNLVEQLVTFYVPSRHQEERGILFYKSMPNKFNDEDFLMTKMMGDEEPWPLRIPDYYPTQLKRLVKRAGVGSKHSKGRHLLFKRLWHPFKKAMQGQGLSKIGLGFEDIQRYECRMVSANNAPDGKEEDSIEDESDDYLIKDVKLKDAPPELEDGGQATIDELEEINLGSVDDPKPTFISAQLTEEEKEAIRSILVEYIDCFAWSYKDMPGLDMEVAVHKLAIDPRFSPVKQAPRKMKFDLEEQVIEETKKLIEAGFIREEKYPDWIASIVPVKKKNGQIRICVDFRDLNKACPKDDFPLPVMEIMIDNTSSYEMFSFMDGFSGYNQIKMSPEDEKHTAFRTPIGIYCYKVMPFGLKNAGATYQRAMTKIFDDLIHQVVECYVDDLVVKTQSRDQHLNDLKTVFDRIRKYNLKMNPMKCAFGVLSGKFLGFVVRHRGIEIDPSKIKAIIEMPPPKTLKQLRSFQGRLAYIRRFIANLSGRCKPFSKLVKKNAPFKWDDECQIAFEEVKRYLLNPPVLAAPITGKPLILYTTALDGSLGALLAQENEEGKENALYYLSRMLVGAESRYTPIEKYCLSLVFAVKKLRHYLLSHKVILISRIDPLKYLMTRPLLTGRLAKWALILMEFDITYTPQKAIKGQALADFLATHPLPDNSPLNYDLPDEETLTIEEEKEQGWKMYFDGASSIQPAIRPKIPQVKAGIGLIFISPDGGILRYSLSLVKPCTNNEAEYEALIAGLELAIKMGIQNLHIYGDSQLIINQVEGSFKTYKQELLQYYQRVIKLMKQIPDIKLERVSRSVNGKADSLAKLAKELADPNQEEIQVTIRNRRVLSSCLDEEIENECSKGREVLTIVEDDWMGPFVKYLKYGELPEEKSLATQLKKRAMRFTLINDVLYRRSYDQLLLRCLSKEESDEIMHEVHSGICGAHQSGPKMRLKIKHTGYYWPTMIKDCMEYARRCKLCQAHGDFIHQHPNPLHPTVSSWPFEMWGTDVIGPIEPPSSRGHRFILGATDYFSRWAEAIPLKEVKAENIIKFFKDHVLYKFGTPRRIISDNGRAFKSFKVGRFAQHHKIDWRYSSIYNARANGLAEAFNKTLSKLLKKAVSKSKRDWHERLPEVLWAYRTTYRTPTQSTPYSLVFGTEAVLPLEVQIPSLRIALQNEFTNEDRVRLRLDELDSLDEKRLEAQQNLEVYKARMARAYNKMARIRTFEKGEMVWVLRRPIITNKHAGGKFKPNWEGPYIIEVVYEGGAYQLVDADGQRPMPPINARFLKKYYP